MSFRKSAQIIINKLIKPLGIKIERADLADLSAEAFLKRAQQKFGNSIKGIIDIGASDGRWSEIAKKNFPEAQYLLIEAQSRHEQKLKTCIGKNPEFQYAICAAGDQEGEIYFDSSDPFGGLASNTPLTSAFKKVPVHTVDYLIQKFQLKAPYLLKLDTHGFEVPILNGAKETLKNTSLIVMEVYNFDVAPNALRFHEMCSLLEKEGFRCLDLTGPLFRPTDQAFWQIDLVFARADLNIFKDNSYNSAKVESNLFR